MLSLAVVVSQPSRAPHRMSAYNKAEPRNGTRTNKIKWKEKREEGGEMRRRRRRKSSSERKCTHWIELIFSGKLHIEKYSRAFLCALSYLSISVRSARTHCVRPCVCMCAWIRLPSLYSRFVRNRLATLYCFLLLVFVHLFFRCPDSTSNLLAHRSVHVPVACVHGNGDDDAGNRQRSDITIILTEKMHSALHRTRS